MRTVRVFVLVILAALPLTTMISFGNLPLQKKMQAPTIHIEGRVVNQKGTGVQGVNIAIADIDNPGQKLVEVLTNFTGRYSKDVPTTKNGYIVTPTKGRNAFDPQNIKLKMLGGTADFKMK